MAEAPPPASHPQSKPKPDDATNRNADEPVEEDPAIERGERIHTSKTIARGGKNDGEVQGAAASTPQPGKS